MATLGLTEASPLSESEHQVQLRRAVIASTIGTAIEWYDFFLYSTMTGLVFAKLFFPRSEPLVGTLEAFGSLCRGLRCPAGRCCDIRPLWRSHRTQIHADCNPDAHGHRDVPGVAGADL